MDYCKRLIERYPELRDVESDIQKAFQILVSSYETDGKLLICGNGGSASDADHIVGELMKGFYKKRPLKESEKKGMEEIAENLQGALPAISLTMHPALSTAFLNDVNPQMIFAQQLFGLGRPGDVLLALSTSGNSRNVVNAVMVAKARGIKVISMTGRTGGILKEYSDVCIRVPADITADIQELHLPIYHALCAMLESYFFLEE